MLGLLVLEAWAMIEEATVKSRAKKNRMPVVYCRSPSQSTKLLG
jgi:hypothetical protein